ncbi:RDD family protein [Kribbella sp. NPDC051587]|uniref:RDD family protein n=1 Tax=Kribbella sp. NPDC051587 TaxID=3364119 RepID=UPI0037960316
MSFPAGWYDDPQNPTQQRYWDGSVWTDQRRPREQPSPYQGQYGQPAQSQPQYGQPAQHGQVYGGGQAQPPVQDRPVYGQPGPQQQPPPQYGQSAYPAYSQTQQQGYGYPGQNRFATPDGQPLSGWWRRVGARVIDNILVFFLSLPLTGYFWWRYLDIYMDNIDHQMKGSTPPSISEAMSSSLEAIAWTIPATLLMAAVMFGYEYLMLTKKGATIGKMALGIAVRERDVAGKPSSAAVAKRAGCGFVLSLLGAIPLIGSIVGLVGLLNYLWPLWDDKKQALWDKIAGTNVVRS